MTVILMLCILLIQLHHDNLLVSQSFYSTFSHCSNDILSFLGFVIANLTNDFGENGLRVMSFFPDSSDLFPVDNNKTNNLKTSNYKDNEEVEDYCFIINLVICCINIHSIRIIWICSFSIVCQCKIMLDGKLLSKNNTIIMFFHIFRNLESSSKIRFLILINNIGC